MRSNFASRHVNIFFIFTTFVYKSFKFCFHSDRRATASYVARSFQQILNVNHFKLFHSTGFRTLFQVKLVFYSHNEHEIFVSVGNCDKSFEHVSFVLIQFVCDIFSAYIVSYRVFYIFIPNFFFVEHSHCVSFFHKLILSLLILYYKWKFCGFIKYLIHLLA